MARGKINDLTGNFFGKLVVIGRGEDYITPKGKRHIRWKCLCECGNECISRASDLNSGRKNSCGCLKNEHLKDMIKENRNKKDISGNTYNNVYVVKKTDKSDSSRRSIYECKCLLCGKIFETTGRHIETGLVKSCGCFAKENRMIQFEKNIKPYQVEKTNVYLCVGEKISKNNTSGVTGVSWNNAKQQWVAQIMFKRKNYVLYQGNSKEIAIQRRKEAEENLRGDFLKWYIEQYPEKANKILATIKFSN